MIKLRTLCIVAVVGLAGCASSSPSVTPIAKAASPAEQSALDLVNRRIAAYNAHDIDAFAATYADDVRIYSYPDRLTGTGRARMRGIFAGQFARNQGHIVVLGQHVLNNVVVSEEMNTIGNQAHHAIAIYTVQDGLIAEVRLVEEVQPIEKAK